jgi:ABC-type transport system involved in multi-copper enzyme maturation permease subunit
MSHNQLLTIAKYSIFEAVRDKFLLFILFGVIMFFCLSLFIGELAIIEGVQIQSAVLAYVLRLFSVFTIGLFVITSMVREFNDKGFELILSHPVPRSSYYFGKFVGFSVVAFLIALMSACCLSLYVSLDLIFFWSFSLFCELLIIISLSLLSQFSFNSITISFSVIMAFYILSRSIEAIQLISDSPILQTGTMSHELINSLLDVIAYIIPDLYKFTQTDWLVYLTEFTPHMFIVVGQTIIYVAFLSSVALFDLYRKEL